LRHPRAAVQLRIVVRFHLRLRRKLDPRLKHVLGVAHPFKEGSEKGGKRRPFAIERKNQIGGFWPGKLMTFRMVSSGVGEATTRILEPDGCATWRTPTAGAPSRAICRKMRVDKKYSCRRYLSANRNICRLKKR
jgi:hypothetical protein